MTRCYDVPKIIITIEGGVIQDIENIPFGVTIEVRDYDAEGIEEDKLTIDDNGDYYIESIWEGKE